MKNTISSNSVSPGLWLDYNGWRSKSNIVPDFNHCKYMLDSEMKICYLSATPYTKKNVLCTININKNKPSISVSEKEVLISNSYMSVFEKDVNSEVKEWLIQSFEDKLISLISQKIDKLKGRI